MTAPNEGRSANGAALRRPSSASARTARPPMPLSNPTRQTWLDVPTLRLSEWERAKYETEARSRDVARPYVWRPRADEGRL